MINFYMKVSEFLYCRITLLIFRLFSKNVNLGRGVRMRKGFYLRPGVNAKISIRGGCFFNRNFSACAYQEIIIGTNCIFGENVKIYDHNHRHEICDIPFKEQGFTISPVEIGDNVWVGSNCVILQGVVIGSNSVIGAGCTVYQNVPPNSVVVGSQGMRFI